MTVSVPLIAIAAILVYLAYRYAGLRTWHAVAAAVLGFLLAATSAAPQIHSVLAGLLSWLQSAGKR
jgi:hypothetical protein